LDTLAGGTVPWGASQRAKAGVLETLRLLFAKIRVGECYGHITTVIESETGDENTSILCNFEQKLDCHFRHDILQRVWGVLFGNKAYNRVLTLPLWHHRDTHISRKTKRQMGGGPHSFHRPSLSRGREYENRYSIEWMA
jgi:hypothetical protein